MELSATVQAAIDDAAKLVESIVSKILNANEASWTTNDFK